MREKCEAVEGVLGTTVEEEDEKEDEERNVLGSVVMMVSGTCWAESIMIFDIDSVVIQQYNDDM